MKANAVWSSWFCVGLFSFLTTGEQITFNDTFIDDTIPSVLARQERYIINFTDSDTIDNWLINSHLLSNSDSFNWEIWNQTTHKVSFRFESHVLIINVKCFVFATK